MVVVVVVEGEQWKCGGDGKTIEMWWWWYIVSLFTKQCWKKKVECRVDVGSMQGRCGVDVVVDGTYI